MEVLRRKPQMEIPIKIEFDGEKLKELVEQAVDNLIA
jgi:hypothetical protein